MIGDFRAVSSIARFAVELIKQTLKRMLVHFGRHGLVVTALAGHFKKSKFALKKLMIVNLIDYIFSTAFVVRASNHNLIIQFGGQ